MTGGLLDAALAYAKAGFRIFPLLPRSKTPAIKAWQLDATDDLDQIRAWWTKNPNYNIGLACGPQPNGRNILVIDIDAHHGGDVSWTELIAVHGGDFGGLPIHLTPNRGFHGFFDAPREFRNSRSKLGVGIDTRGAGGYVVLPPSVAPDDDGELQGYSVPANGLITHDPLPAPQWVLELLMPPAPAYPPDQLGGSLVSVAPTRDKGDGWSAADYVRERYDFSTYLIKHGWLHVGGEYWRRPGKSDRSHSATLKNNGTGPLNVFTTSIPTELERLGTTSADGTCVSISLFDFIAAYEYGGDRSALGREITRLHCPTRHLHIVREPEPEPEPSSLNLPAEFWELIPFLTEIRNVAWSVGESPTALLMAILAHYAPLVPPGFVIPNYVGDLSNLNIITVIAGSSGAGKTSMMRLAQRLIPIHRKDLRVGLGLGSGEGIIEAYYGNVVIEDDKGRKTKERQRVMAGVSFAIDEGVLFSELAGRGGTTHVSRMCSAWSAAALSTANANQETFRQIDALQYAFGACLGIQTFQAEDLLGPDVTNQGFVGRLTLGWCEDPVPTPAERPARVDIDYTIDVAIPAGPPHIAQRWDLVEIPYSPVIVDEVIERHHARRGTTIPPEAHHHDLQRMKLAGLLALMGGERSVSSEPYWTAGTMLADHSSATRSYLRSIHSEARRARRHAAATLRAESELVVESVKERQGIASMAENIRRKCAEQSWGLNKLARTVAKHALRHRFDPALELAVANGWVVVEGDRVRKV